MSPEQLPYFEWFIHGTAANTPRIYNSPSWDPVVLQSSVQEPMVLSAILAVSSAHKRRMLDPIYKAESGPPDKSETFMLKHYSDAIIRLKKHISGGGKMSHSDMLLAVITCGLLTLLEYLNGHQPAGLMHLQIGVHMARQLMNDSRDSQIGTHLIQFYDRLVNHRNINEYLQTATLPSPPPSPTSASLSSLPSSNPRFTSVGEASALLDTLIDNITQITEESDMIPLSATKLRARLEEKYQALMASFASWAQSCYETISAQGPGIEPSVTAQYIALGHRCAMARRLAAHSMSKPPGDKSGKNTEPEVKSLDIFIGARAGDIIVAANMAQRLKKD